MDQGAFLAVSWEGNDNRTQQRCLSEADLGEFERARQLGTQAPGSLINLLSALGREIDHEEIEVSRIAQQGEGFVVSGVSHGRYANNSYTYRELGHRSGLGQALRPSPPSPAPQPSVAPAPLAAVQAAPLPAAGVPNAPLRRRLQLQ
jgi:hypothetical protein